MGGWHRICGMVVALAWPGVGLAGPVYDSTADTVFDIITEGDPSAFLCLRPLGQAPRQIWDKRVDGEPVIDAHLFEARYSDGARIKIAVNPEFPAEAAEAIALRFAVPLGQLPTALRAGIGRFSVHGGDQGFHAGDGQIVVYTGRADLRAAALHLEESLFHEAVHASWDRDHAAAPDWLAAQQADGGFLTGYAEAAPEVEDLAETALFAFAILHHPKRFPPVDTADTRAAVPHRIAYFAGLLPPGAPLIVPLAGAPGCEADS